jgi:hypothetical protein
MCPGRHASLPFGLHPIPDGILESPGVFGGRFSGFPARSVLLMSRFALTLVDRLKRRD